MIKSSSKEYILVFIIIFLFGCNPNSPNEENNKNILSDDEINNILIEIEQDINSRLPRKLKYTTWESVIAGNKEITYKYRIHAFNPIEIEKNKDMFKKELFVDIKNGSCTDPSTRDLLKLGVRNIYVYHDINNQYLFEFYIDKTICKS